MTSSADIDILLVNPGVCSEIYQQLAGEYSAIETPALAATFVSYFQQFDCSVAIVDAPALNLSPQKVAQFIDKNYNPILIVLVVYGFQPSASTQNMTSAGQTSSYLKQINPDFKIMMTGTHPAALPKRTLHEEKVDFVCSQEGPQTILQTTLALKAKSDNYTKIPGLWYKKDGKCLSTFHGPIFENLDQAMPNVAWDLLPMKNYRAHNWHCFENISERQPYASLYTTLGCPFQCSFCCINAPFGCSSYRKWSPNFVIRQIDTLVTDYGVRNIKFIDEMFVLHKDHVNNICDLIIERGYDLNIWAYARIDTITDEMLEKLATAGIRWLALGIESGSKHVRDGVSKGRFGTENVLEIVRKIQNAGINVLGNYIFGLPEDTHESMQETLDLAIEANCEFANFYCGMAYPGSQLYEIAITKGWELPDTWIGFSQHAYETKPLPTNYLSAAEVLKFRDEAFEKYFANFRYLDTINKKFGSAASDHIKKMTTIKLRRKLLEV